MSVQDETGSNQVQHLSQLASISLIVLLAGTTLLTLVATRKAPLVQTSSALVERPGTQHDIVQREVSHQPLSEADSYHFRFWGLSVDRWAAIVDSPFDPPFRLPQPGEQISLSGDHLLPVPAYLPEGFMWLDVFSDQSGRMFPTMASFMEGANGDPRPPYYDLSVVSFLTGSDPGNRLLILAQIADSSEVEFALRFFYILSPTRRPDFTTLHAEGVPTPTFTSEDKLVGIVGAPAAKGGITIAIGAPELHETTVSQEPAWWCHGTWSIADEWDNSSTLTNLIWRSDGYIYQLTGEGIVLDDLIKTAQSMP